MVFMNGETYEQETVSADVLGEQAKWVADGQTVTLLKFRDRVIALEMPNSVQLSSYSIPSLVYAVILLRLQPAKTGHG